MYTFKDPARITLIAVACVAIFMVTDLLLTVALTLVAGDSLQGDYPDPTQIEAVGVLAIANLAVLLTCVVVVGMWTYRASANAHSFSDEMTITPGWAVGWYFVPFMNLVRPYQAMREIWLASHFRGNWHGEPGPPILGWWWGLWIITGILGNISWRLSDEPAAAEPVYYIDIVSGVLNVILCVVLIIVMRTIARAQTTAVHDEVFA